MRKDKKDDEAAASNPFAGLDKSTVVQETRIFNDTPVNARKCAPVLCKLLYLLQHGETIGKTEATDTFFAITKLWQAKDVTLRLLVYLAIKELSTISSDVIIVTSSLTKDMTGREDVYRPSAIRALCRITDSGMLQAIERYMKQAIVDKVPSVSSAALVSSLHLMKKSPDVIRRWVNEVQEAVSSDNHMVQYHALGLLYCIRSSDRLAITKMVQKFSKSGLRSPLALCYLIRIASKLIEEDETGSDRAPFAFIESCLRHKSEMVIYEAASAIVKLPRISSGELASAVSVLQLFCSSPKPALRFASVRTLNKISMNYPQAVISCNVDLEQLITDQNRSIATLAITTLLKTGAEASVERLMKQIGTFVSEISDEFKIVVIEAIRSLCGRYPRKHATMMNFLASMLRDEGGFEYKKAIVDTIITIVDENPAAKDLGLSHLCEFIEDCEHPALATRVLHLLGREGPTTQNPARYIRFIYNRVILETTQVRAAAVTALAKFGAECTQLRHSILVLLKRCLLDTDDEVRDRATFYWKVLCTGDAALISKYILDTLKVSVIGLERSLEQYISAGNFEKMFDIKQVPLSTQPITTTEPKKSALSAEAPVKKEEKAKASRQEIYAEQISAIPEFAQLGPLFKSSKAIELTESVTEYNVSCIKHVLNDHVLLQFDCRNTLNDQLLENVSVVVEPTDEGPWKVSKVLPLPSLPYSHPGTTYVLMEIPDDGQITGSFNATLKFQVRDVDPTTGEPESDDHYDDVYVLESIDLGVADYILPTPPKGSFNTGWEQLTNENEVDETYALSTVNSLDDAVNNLLNYVGLGPCERSEKIPEGKSAHTLLLSGTFRNGAEILARVRLALDPVDQTVTMNIIVRSTDQAVSQMIGNIIE
ncbi:coatomer gamma subunit appendage platform subdomain-containing protein [Ditylenchus destructor]|nr:coatomer gamma subunit appendage platform subdomain-containing protein [Ditylenchus destructor]